MRSYWIWFSFLALTWAFAFSDFIHHAEQLPWRMTMSALFFALYFISPLFRHKPLIHTLVLSVSAVLAIVALWPDHESTANLFTLLVYSLLAGEAAYRLPTPYAAGIGLIVMLGALAPYLAGYPAISPIFVVLYSLLNAAAFVVFRKTWAIKEETSARNEAIMSEYRKMKRRIVSDEQLVRQEERAQVGRDIHDSVGHKLTALLMQLEVFRMHSDAESASRIQALKELAKESLEETRNAVKALKHQEDGGLSAILSLIRKLEAESFFRVNFTVKHGALLAPLSNNQSTAVYRAVQEALTNIIRHSNTREAEVGFEAPGGSVFQFEISNAMKEGKPFREGFGLRSMRERVESAGGRLEILTYDNRFIVRGTLSMIRKENEEV